MAGRKPLAHPSAVCATARVTAVADGRGGSAVSVIRGEGPLAPRLTGSADGDARVTLVGAMSGPLGGDRLALDVRVEDGAGLRMDSAAATLALPNRDDAASRYDVRLSVGEHGRLQWRPEPLISASRSVLRQTVHAELAPTARLLLREVSVLGRSCEEPGRLTTCLSVRISGRPLLQQRLDFGPGALGWDSAAVLGGHRAVGQLLVVDPELDAAPAEPGVPSPGAVVTPLAGPAVLVTVLGEDALAVSRVLNEALPWVS
ncbi:hypothetical protein AN219_24845 [Streptomyces nanshensis]|nr:hypothetical protein AN219_24845 [Streptomyces nanshensis]